MSAIVAAAGCGAVSADIQGPAGATRVASATKPMKPQAKPSGAPPRFRRQRTPRCGCFVAGRRRSCSKRRPHCVSRSSSVSVTSRGRVSLAVETCCGLVRAGGGRLHRVAGKVRLALIRLLFVSSTEAPPLPVLPPCASRSANRVRTSLCPHRSTSVKSWSARVPSGRSASSTAAMVLTPAGSISRLHGGSSNRRRTSNWRPANELR